LQRQILPMVFVVLLWLGAAPPARAEGGWTTPHQIDPDFSVISISCASDSLCVAVDFNGNAVTYDGSGWSAPESIGHHLISVSCPSTSFCVAVGDNEATAYNGASWGSATEIDGGPPFLESVSCPSATFCVAIDSAGNAVTYNGTSWGSPQSVGGIGSVSCVSSSFCMALGETSARTYNGSSWSAPIGVSGSGIRSFSCSSSTFCVAVGEKYARTYNGTAWGSPVQIDSFAQPEYNINSVSCASSSFCVAVDTEGREVTYLNGSWQPPNSIDSQANLEAVSCPSESFCAAASADGYAMTYPWSAQEAEEALQRQREEEAQRKKEEEARQKREAEEERAAAKKLEGAGQGRGSNEVCAAPGSLYPPRQEGELVISVRQSPSGGYCFGLSRPFDGLVICSHFNNIPKGFVVPTILGKAISGDVQFPYTACDPYPSEEGTAWELRRPIDGMVVCVPPSPTPGGFVVVGKYNTDTACSVYPRASGFLAAQIKRPVDGLVMCGGPSASPAGYVVAAQLTAQRCGPVYSIAGFNAIQLKKFPSTKKPTVATKSLVASPKGNVALTITCPSSAGSCSGSVALVAQKAGAASSRPKPAGLGRPSRTEQPLNLGGARFKIAGGKAGIVKLRLRPPARRLLMRVGVLRAHALLAVSERHSVEATASATVKIEKGSRPIRR